MADDQNKKPSIFTKMLEAGSAILDAQIKKSSAQMNQSSDNEDVFYSKAITEDPTYAINAAGWKEKPNRLQDGQLKAVSQADSVVAAIIQTRQNQVSNFSRLVKSEKETGWKLCLRNEEDLLEEIKEQLKAEMGQKPEVDMTKADPEMDLDQDEASNDPVDAIDPDRNEKSDDDVEEYNWELERKAKEVLESKFKAERKKVEDFINYCGVVDGKPQDKKRWNLDQALRAMVRDSLTYDKYCVEIVPDRANRPSYWFPVDGATIKFASNRLKDYRQLAENFLNLDILYPEKKVEAIEKQKVLDLDEDLLSRDMYRYVQVIRGKIERAYTEDELKLGIRNLTTDIYNNGYGISELELAMSLITGHMNAEFYNQAYFTQGFSAKGILHIKAAINRRKIETVRQQWQHMLKGSRNSFQTPIFAGLEDVNWIPLTQNHNDIGFEGWMRYLIKMTCAVYQIDPHEIGIGLKDEGGSGGMSGDATQEKIDQSKDKGLYPLIRHLENFLNEQVIKPFNDKFILKFTGITSETSLDAVTRQEIERRFKKTVNEIRAEDGLPPLPGMDDFIAGPEYLDWYKTFSNKGMKQQQDAMAAQQQAAPGEEEPSNPDELNSFYGDEELANSFLDPEMGEDEVPVEKSLKKSKRAPKKIKIEYYKVK